MILAYAGLASIPLPYRQAAAIDGASAWAVFRHIELPRITRALAIVLLLRCVDSLMIYTEAFTINAGGPGDATRFLTLELGEEIKGFSYGQAAARSTLYFLIVLAIVWAFVVRFQAGPICACPAGLSGTDRYFVHQPAPSGGSGQQMQRLGNKHLHRN